MNWFFSVVLAKYDIHSDHSYLGTLGIPLNTSLMISQSVGHISIHKSLI